MVTDIMQYHAEMAQLLKCTSKETGVQIFSAHVNSGVWQHTCDCMLAGGGVTGRRILGAAGQPAEPNNELQVQ